MKTKEEQIDELRATVHQTIGQASMCWQHICGAGIYQQHAAEKTAESLIAYLFDKMELKEEPKK